jgi:hypothetical protein
MTLRTGTIVFLRCLMISEFFYVLNSMAGVFAMYRYGTLDQKLSQCAAYTVLLVPALIVFLTADYWVDLMTPKSDEVLAPTTITLSDLQAIAFSAVGAYILYWAMKETIALLLDIEAISALNSQGGIVRQVQAKDWLLPLLSWPFGFYLLIGAPMVRQWLGQLRRLQAVSATHDDDGHPI